MAKTEATIYTDDHLRKAYDITSSEFWSTYEQLAQPADNRSEQHNMIKELIRLGDSMVKIHEARQALN